MKSSRAERAAGQLEERERAVEFWRKHIEHLISKRLVEDLALQALVDLGVTKIKNIGWQGGKIRPGKPGQWDVFRALAGKFSQVECLILSDLSVIDLAIATRRVRLLKTGVDPNNSTEVAEFDRIQRMSSSEVERLTETYFDLELERLEASLADCDPSR
jgi:hypothetical protein